jgi:hypothetical protein
VRSRLAGAIELFFLSVSYDMPGGVNIPAAMNSAGSRTCCEGDTDRSGLVLRLGRRAAREREEEAARAAAAAAAEDRKALTLLDQLRSAGSTFAGSCILGTLEAVLDRVAHINGTTAFLVGMLLAFGICPSILSKPVVEQFYSLLAGQSTDDGWVAGQSQVLVFPDYLWHAVNPTLDVYKEALKNAAIMHSDIAGAINYSYTVTGTDAAAVATGESSSASFLAASFNMVIMTAAATVMSFM